jgi:hypothetical protein
MITEIYEKIIEIMETMKGAGQPFSEIYPYAIGKSPVFPFAVIDIAPGGGQTDESTNAKVLKFNFIVYCIFRQQNTSASKARCIEVMDLVLTKFNSQGIADYLENTVTGMDITSIEPFESEKSDQPLSGFYFILETRSVIDIA